MGPAIFFGVGMPDLVGQIKAGVQEIAGSEPIIKLGRTMEQAGGAMQDLYRRATSYLPTTRKVRTTDIALPSSKRKVTGSRSLTRSR